MCTCSAPKQFEIFSPVEARIFCIVCHKGIDLFKNEKGKWETSAQRMNRLTVNCKCVKCGKKFQAYKSYFNDELRTCNECQDKWKQEYDAERHIKDKSNAIRNNQNSPWRIGVKGKAAS